jgi:glutathione S-transferase
MASARAKVRSVVSGLVASPSMTSTSFITGTGLKKCIPITRGAAAPTDAAMSVIEIEEVFVARITSSPQTASSFAKISFFRARFSVAASTTHCAWETESSEYEYWIRAAAASASA